MKARGLAILVALASNLLAHGVTARSAEAGGCDIVTSPSTCVAAEEGNVNITKGDRKSATEHTSRQTRHLSQTELASAAQAFCADATANAQASGGTTQAIVDLCGFAAVPASPTREQVRTAFKQIPLYSGAIRTDPHNSTLVNLETYFWCANEAGAGCDVVGEAERTVTLLGQAVRIRPRILSYAWDFGDGAAAQVENGRVAHTYRHATTANVTLTLTWTADYAVGGGGFQPIGDTTTTTSPARALPVREAESVIVSGG